MGRPYVSSYFSPNRGAADLIVGFIDRCTSTIDVGIYSITHDNIAEALIRAHNRGVKIRLLCDKTQAANRYADDEKLIEAGIEVRYSSRSVFHWKTMIGDAASTQRALKTGSFNWSKNADERNAENFVIIRLKYVVDEFVEEFEREWTTKTSSVVSA